VSGVRPTFSRPEESALAGPTIGILSPQLTGHYHGSLVAAISRAVGVAGGRTAAVATSAMGPRWGGLLPHLGRATIDGFVVITGPSGPDQAALGQIGKPVVGIGTGPVRGAHPWVTTDDATGTRKAVAHLVSHGHRRVAFAGHVSAGDVAGRYAAFGDALAGAGIPADEALVYDVEGDDEHAGRAAARHMLADGLPSTAVVAASDALAQGLMAELARAGLVLPERQAVVGFGDLPGVASLCPALSTVSPALVPLGELAATTLMKMVAGAGAPPVLPVVETFFVARESCGCPIDAGAGLSRRLLAERNQAYEDLRQAVHDEHQISLELLRSHESDPRTLGWLAGTKAAAGMLALWSEQELPGPDAGETNPGPGPARAGLGYPGPGSRLPGPGPAVSTAQLEVVGAFDRAGRGVPASGTAYGVEELPPRYMLDGAGRDEAVLVFPVTSEDHEWGVLNVTVALSSGFPGQDTFLQWEALLSEALDYREVLRSLRQSSDQLRERGEQLALSYRREREMAQAARESEERYALAARAASDGLWDWDLDRGTVYYSARWLEMLGYSAGTLGTSPDEWLERAHPDDRPGLLSQLVALKVGDQSSILHEHRLLARDGSYLWVLCRGLAVPGDGRPATRIVGSFTDVTERHLLEERLRQQALYDSLTGLPNRSLFLDRLAQAIANGKRRSGHTYTVLWLDLDGFKVLNDSLGHQMGDKLLVKVGDRIRSHLRESDTAARFGGDEFAVLLLDIPDAPTVEVVVRRLLDKLGATYDLDGHDIVVTASIGVAMSSVGYERAEDVLRDADIAMYRAKAEGRGTYTLFHPSMRATAAARLKAETELRQGGGRPGQSRSQMELHYQPIVDILSGRVSGLEAFVRWRHPLRGLVTPLEFLQVAEDSGLIVPMGRWVAAEACRQLSVWEAAHLLSGDVRVSLNLSNREFWGPKLLDHLDAVLSETGVRPDRLAFEITEGVIIDDLDHAHVVLRGLHERGLQVHVDDFGTGHSSLQALHSLPIDALKIDRSYVSGLGQDERTVERVRTVVQVGHDLGVTVVAEGVETVSQLETLRQLSCPNGQGYYFSPPVPALKLEHLVSSGRSARHKWAAQPAALATAGAGPARAS
jgi:diguanylate cyclase (GGDEF)-like protein/PAS domain S-box-containing protein